ncbi:MAG: oxygen-independent coproporphyrinogen III oxidase, partial [Planctomycetota bacterium]
MRLDILAKYDRPVPRYTSYPTAPHFHDRIGPQAYADWLAEIPPDEPLSLYVHIPFCDSLCWFCGCHTKIVRRYAPVRDYLEVVGRELDLLVERLGGPRRLRHLHFGGGTPTILEPRDVREVGRLLHRHFTFGEETDFAVEIDPREVRREMLAAWADIGLTRASLGVQDVNPDVQEAVNRIQPFEVTARVVEWLRASGIRGINFDLMYGLPLQTAEHLLVTVDKALTLEPERLALFGYAHVPWMKRHQRLISDSDLPGARDRLIQSEAAHGRLAAAGYVPIGLDHFARPDDPLARALENGTLHRNF